MFAPELRQLDGVSARAQEECGEVDTADCMIAKPSAKDSNLYSEIFGIEWGSLENR